jgi:hypothetical protein
MNVTPDARVPPEIMLPNQGECIVNCLLERVSPVSKINQGDSVNALDLKAPHSQQVQATP